MNQNVKFIALFLVFASLATLALGFIPKASAPAATSGLLIKLYSNQAQGENDLANGNIDIEGWPLSRSFVMAHTNDPTITMDAYFDLGMAQFDLNDQLWPTGPITTPRTGAKNGFFDPAGERDIAALHFRRAIAHLSNKVKFVQWVFNGYVMETIVPVPALEGYTDYTTLQNSTAVNDDPFGSTPANGITSGYLYAYNHAEAIAEFNLGNFKDWDADTYLEWKSPSTGIVEELPNMKMWALLEDPIRRQVAQDLYNELLLAGIPQASGGGAAGLELRVAIRRVCLDAVTVNYDYNIYTGGGWSVGADPDFIYDLIHSSMGQYAYATNYPGFKNHDFDPYAEALKYTPADSDNRFRCIQAQWVANKYCPIVWLWCIRGVKGYRTGWQNVINEACYGIDNFWSFDLMQWIGHDTIKYGLLGSPSDLNVITSGDSWPELVVPQTDALLPNAKVLSCIYDSLLRRNPYSLAEEVGAFASSWSTIDNYPGWEGRTVCEFNVRTDATFHDGSPVKPADVAYSILLVTAAGAGNAWNYPAVRDVYWIDLAPGNIIRVFFNVQVAFALHWSGFMPIINKDLWDAAIGAGTPAGYTGYIPDDYIGRCYPGTFTNPAAMRDYHPWEQDANGNGIIDLNEDGSGPWVYVPFAAVNTIALTAYSGFYNTISRQTAPGVFTSMTIINFVNVAFHNIGNVNYPGGYGVTHEWYTADRVIDIHDLGWISNSLGTRSTDPWGPNPGQYNPDADINNDTYVNVIDLGTCGAHFGLTMG